MAFKKAAPKMTDKLDMKRDAKAGIRENSKKDLALDKRFGIKEPGMKRGKGPGPQPFPPFKGKGK